MLSKEHRASAVASPLAAHKRSAPHVRPICAQSCTRRWGRRDDDNDDADMGNFGQLFTQASKSLRPFNRDAAAASCHKLTYLVHNA